MASVYYFSEPNVQICLRIYILRITNILHIASKRMIHIKSLGLVKPQTSHFPTPEGGSVALEYFRLFSKRRLKTLSRDYELSYFLKKLSDKEERSHLSLVIQVKRD